MVECKSKCPFHVLYFHLVLFWGLICNAKAFTGVSSSDCPVYGKLKNQVTCISQSFASGPGSELYHQENNPNGYRKLFQHSYVRYSKRRNDESTALHFSSAYDVDTAKHKNRDEKLEVVVIGLSHHTANVGLREKLAIPEEQWSAVSKELCQFDSISEAAVLSTCNRFEVYLAGPDKEKCVNDAMEYLHQRMSNSNHTISTDELKSGLFALNGEDAVWHLMRVTAGLDSLVVGEGQILAQVKRAHDQGITSAGGSAGKVVTRLLNSAVTAGKRVRTETDIAKGAVSVSSAASEFTKLKLEQMSEGHMTLSNANVAILGAGKMARLLLIHLQSIGVQEVTVVNRSPERVQGLQEEFPKMKIHYEALSNLSTALQRADVCFPSTKSNITLIDPEPLRQCISRRAKSNPLLFVDISVPRNVHPDCAMVPNVHCYNVDDLKVVVEKNTAKRADQVTEAEKILREETDKFLTWQTSLEALPTITALQEKAEAVRMEELGKATHKLNITEQEKVVLDRMTRGIIAKLLHGPMSHLRSQREGVSTRLAINQIQQAFQL